MGGGRGGVDDGWRQWSGGEDIVTGRGNTGGGDGSYCGGGDSGGGRDRQVSCEVYIKLEKR